MIDVNSIFQSATQEGDISPQSLNILNLLDVGNQISGQIGLAGLNIQSSEVLLVAIQPDDSGSMQINKDACADGHNGVIDALMESKQRKSISLRTQYLNGFVLNDWVMLENAVKMDRSNYDPMKGTPLYDNAVVLLGSIIKEVYEAKQNGQVARFGVLFVTDGADVHSRKARASDVKTIVDDIQMNEQGIVAFLGIGSTNFNQVALDMGIRQEWILNTTSDHSAIRRAFNVFSSSMVRASQNSASFSAVAAGGFAVLVP